MIVNESMHHISYRSRGSYVYECSSRKRATNDHTCILSNAALQLCTVKLEHTMYDAFHW